MSRKTLESYGDLQKKPSPLGRLYRETDLFSFFFYFIIIIFPLFVFLFGGVVRHPTSQTGGEGGCVWKGSSPRIFFFFFMFFFFFFRVVSVSPGRRRGFL